MIHPEGRGSNCKRCKQAWARHEKIKVFPDDCPPGSWHWFYSCPGSGVPA